MKKALKRIIYFLLNLKGKCLLLRSVTHIISLGLLKHIYMIDVKEF